MFFSLKILSNIAKYAILTGLVGHFEPTLLQILCLLLLIYRYRTIK